MKQTAKQPLFPLGQIVTMPAAPAALEKVGQDHPSFLFGMRMAIGEACAMGTARKTSSTWNTASQSFRATASTRAISFRSLPTTTSR